MNQSIVVDITEVVEKQKESKNYNIKLAILLIGILVFCALTVAGIYNISSEIFYAAALIVVALTVLLYNIPGVRTRKFLKPYIDNMLRQLESKGFTYKDRRKNKNLNPWFSGASQYLYGKGLSLAKDSSKGLKARKLKFLTRGDEEVVLSVERLSSQNSVFLKVVELDKKGSPVEVELNEQHPLSMAPPDVFQMLNMTQQPAPPPQQEGFDNAKSSVPAGSGSPYVPVTPPRVLPPGFVEEPNVKLPPVILPPDVTKK